MDNYVLRVRKKGILILPKKLREAIGIDEGEVIAEVKEDSIVIRPLRPKIVKVNRDILEKILGEEAKLEEEKLENSLSRLRG